MNTGLQVQNLKVSVPTPVGPRLAVDDVSFELQKGKSVALVGESGSGKSLTAYALMRLLRNPVNLESGNIILNGETISNLSTQEFRRIRGGKMGMIYQDPMSALNPLMKIGQQIVESIRTHSAMDKHSARKRAIQLLEEVGISEAKESFNAYPFEFSGGMLQRVVIAMALSGNPEILIADEATTALDVTTQARVLNLISKLASDRGLSVLLITHDLGVAAQFADELVVMYAGKIVEKGEIKSLFSRPLHPYTQALLDSRCDYTIDFTKPIKTILGQPPRPENRMEGCAFAPRCKFKFDICEKIAPSLEEFSNHLVSCLRVHELNQIVRIRDI